MACHAYNQTFPPQVVPHTTRARRPRVRLIIPDVCDLLLSSTEAMDLADQLVDVAESLPAEKLPSETPRKYTP